MNGESNWRKRIRKFLKISGISLLSCIILFFLLNLLFPVPDRVVYSTIITDRRNEVVHAFLTPDEHWRMQTTLEEISPTLKKAIVYKEDQYFYHHPGINLMAVFRAFGNNILQRRRTSGASTITMQVARALEPGERTYWHKIREMFRALQLEWKYSKEEILQLYLNLVPYGGNIEGVKSASILYFGKNPDHLSLAEITALSIIPNRPSSLVIGRNNDRIVQERNRWLVRFREAGIFSAKEVDDALAEPLTAKRGSVPRLIPHLAYKLKKSGDPIIHTSIDMNLQSKTELLVEDYVRGLRLKNIHNAAVLIIDNRTHQVVSYIGSADFRDTTDGGQVNGAAAIRQPGSTLKPLLYGLCIDEGLLTPKMVITDVAVNYAGYTPENYDRQFNGYVTMEYALEHSLNIPAVKALNQLGKEKLLDKLVSCRFEQIRKDRPKLGLSLILGGCGSSLEELTSMYSLFANNGQYYPASVIQLPKDSSQRPTRILSSGATFMINEILSKVNRPDFPLNWQSTEHMPKIAWKTGTSYGRRDGWSIGYNSHYTVGVWTGNFNATGVAELSGANTATPLLFRIFNTIDYDADEAWFQQPADCELRQVCAETGLLPEDQCGQRVTDYFIPLISTVKHCDNRQEIMLSADGRISYCRQCAPATGYRTKWFRIISPDMQHYFEENRMAYEKIPPHNPDCEKVFLDGVPVITSPRNGAEYLINRKNPEPLQLSCNTGNDVSKVYWYINNRFYKTTEAGSKQFFLPDEGPVKISCTDDKGRNRDIWIRVKYISL